MTEGRLEDIDIRRAQREKNTDHLVVDAGSARVHISLAEKGCITVHDSDKQSSIILDDEQNVNTVTHEDDVTVVDRTGSLVDPKAVTSGD